MSMLMHKSFRILVILLILLADVSCRKLDNYFRDPETETLVETLQATVITGYAANLAMAVMEGQTFPNVVVSKSNPGFPCTTLMVVDMSAAVNPLFTNEKVTAITIAGLWSDESTAILTMLYTDYHIGSSTLDLVGIETIPVIRDGDKLLVALAGMDIRLNPDQESILRLNLTTLEIESELFRLEAPLPADVYVAIEQNAYFINVNNNGTVNNPGDDCYTISGGGQLIEVAGNSAEIVQQALIEVKVSAECKHNPLDGMALIKVTGLEDKEFPELGTALLQCPSTCSGATHVIIATGMYIGSNGHEISFNL